MLHVERTRIVAPAILSDQRTRQALRDVERVLSLPEQRRLQRRPSFDGEILLDPALRAAIADLFYGKCAFCETKLSDLSIGHFRPRVNASNINGEVSDVHHYSWLAYDWGNLYAVCKACNSSQGSRFPVRGARAPLFTSLDEARDIEQQTLVDPCVDEPRKHLKFTWSGVCWPYTERGKTTVDVFGLNRPALIASRLQVSEQIGAALRQMRLHDFVSLRDDLGPLLLDKVEYSGAAADMVWQFAAEIADQGGRSLTAPGRGRSVLDLLEDALTDASTQDVDMALEFIAAETATQLSPEDLVPINQLGGVAVADSYPLYAAPTQRLQFRDNLRSLTVKNFKAIKRLKISLLSDAPSGRTPCLMLLGENGTGKSSLLEALALGLVGTTAADALVERPTALLRRKDPNRWGLIDVSPVEIEIEFAPSGRRAELVVDPARLFFEGVADPSALVLGYGPRRFFSPKRGARRKAADFRVRTIFDPVATIPDPLPWLRKLGKDQFFSVARALREILSLDEDDDFVQDPGLGICVRSAGVLSPVDRLSDGYKSLFVMSVDIMRSLLDHWSNIEDAVAIVLIDEIETHLHPRWKMTIMSSLRKAFPSVTFVATTHDPLCLRGMDDGEVVVLRRGEDGISSLSDLPSIRGMRADQILTSDYFGLGSTVDPLIEQELSDYVSAMTKPEDVADGKSAIEVLDSELSRILTLGSNAAEQVADEAMKAYLVERRRSAAGGGVARSRAAAAILKALRPSLDDD